VGSCQRSGIEDLVSDCAVAAGMTAICFTEEAIAGWDTELVWRSGTRLFEGLRLPQRLERSMKARPYPLCSLSRSD